MSLIFKNYQDDFEKTIGIVLIRKGFLKIRSTRTTWSYINEYRNDVVILLFNYDIRDNFFYFSINFYNAPSDMATPLVEYLKQKGVILNVSDYQPSSTQYIDALNNTKVLIENSIDMLQT
jgi:hypothetical protein